MPSNKTSKNPDGIEIKFNERWHKYTSETGSGKIEYVSATTLIHQFVTPFDAPLQAARVAERDGKTTEEVLKEWEDKRKYASDFGTRIHESCEDVLLNNSKFRNKFEDETERSVFNIATSVAQRIKDNMEVLDVEKIVFDVDDKIAGTIDLFAKDKNGVLWIMDWKTNGAIDKYSKYRNYMLEPISSLHDCNFNHYSLQLSLYERILKKCKYIPSDSMVKRALIHLTPNNFTFMHTPDFSNHVDVIIKAYQAKIEEDAEIPF